MLLFPLEPKHHSANVLRCLLKNILPKLLSLLGVLFFLWNAFYVFPWTLDDPFISFRYAFFLNHGQGLVFNPGERVEGYTNLLWTLWSAFGMILGFNPLCWSKISGVLLGLGCLRLLYRLGERIYPGNESRKALIASLLILLTGASFWWGLWMLGGLETPLFSFLILGTAWRFSQEALNPQKKPIAGFLASLLILTRPDGAVWILALLICLGVFSFFWKNQKRNLTVYALSIFFVVVGYSLFKLSYYGQILPNTYYAKVSDFSEDIKLGFFYISNALYISLGTWLLYPKVALDPQHQPMGPSWLPVLLVVFLLFGWLRLLVVNKENKPLILFLFMGWGGYLCFILLSSGDWMPGFRFIVPVLPLTIIPILGFLFPINNFLGRVASIFAIIFFLFSGMFIQKNYCQRQIPWIRSIAYRFSCGPQESPYLDLANWIKKNLKKGSLIAFSEAGIVPYYCPKFLFLDYLGLTDPYISHLHGSIHQKTDPSYILSRKPKAIILIGQKKRKGFKGTGAFQRFFEFPPLYTEYSLAHKIERGANDFFFIFLRKQD